MDEALALASDAYVGVGVLDFGAGGAGADAGHDLRSYVVCETEALIDEILDVDAVAPEGNRGGGGHVAPVWVGPLRSSSAKTAYIRQCKQQRQRDRQFEEAKQSGLALEQAWNSMRSRAGDQINVQKELGFQPNQFLDSHVLRSAYM